MSDSLWPHGLQQASFPVLHYPLKFAQTHVHWVGDAIQQSHPLSILLLPSISLRIWSLLMSRLFTPGGQSIEVSVSASVLTMNIQGWFPLGWTSLISLLSKGLSRVFYSTTVRKCQFFIAQPSLWSNFHNWKNHSSDYTNLCQQSDISAFSYSI